MQSKITGISIVIPQYNEEENLRSNILLNLKNQLEKFTIPWEVIIIDDGSTDGSAGFSSEFVKTNQNFKQIIIPHSGKAGALLEGIYSSKYEWLLLTDMDQSTPISEFEKLAAYSEEYNVIIGSRGYFRKNSSLFRKFASLIFTGLRKALVLREIDDTQCGFKLIKADVAKKLFPKLDILKKASEIKGWSVSAFDVEFLYMAKKTGEKIKEVEVVWHDQDLSKTKKRKFVRESLEMLKQITQILRNDLKGKYRQLK